MVRVGQEVRRLISEGLGEEAMTAVLEQVQLTEQEASHPWLHRDALERKARNAEDIDLREVFESFFGSPHLTLKNQEDFLRWRKMQQLAEQKHDLGLPLEEAEVMSNQFQLLTQAKLYATMMATYELTRAVYEQLFDTFVSPFKLFDHQIPSDAPELSYTPENADYPTRTLSDRYCQTKANKFGAIIPITREVILTDRFGQVTQQAKGLAASAKYREDQLAALAWADGSNATLIPDASEQDAGAYFPERTNYALYRTAAVTTGSQLNYQTAVNQIAIASNYLNNWTQLQNAIQLMLGMTNVKGQLIETIPATGLTLVVPYGLAQRASILKSSVLTVTDTNNSASTENIQMRAINPLANLGIQGTVNVLVWNKLTTAATASQSAWYLAGNSKLQFKRHMRWDVEFNEATPAQLGGDDFTKDVIYKVRSGFNTGFRAVDDKYVVAAK